MKYTIPVITLLQDCGDGGWTMYAYNTQEELIDNHPKSREYKRVNGKWQDVPVTLTPEQIRDIMAENDPYENGYIGEDTIEVEVGDNGVACLIKPLSFHVGQ